MKAPLAPVPSKCSGISLKRSSGWLVDFRGHTNTAQGTDGNSKVTLILIFIAVAFDL